LKKFNCSPKFDQTVKLPTRDIVKNIFNEFSNLFLDQIYSKQEFIKVLAEKIAERFRVNVLHAEAVEVDINDVGINGYYDSDDDEQCKIAIELVLVTNPRSEYILFDQEKYDLFVINLADVLAHELIHMRQYRARDFIPIDFHLNKYIDLDEEIMYLSSPDEIDAYAYNIADELRVHPNPIKKLADLRSITLKDSINLWAYLNAFSYDFKSPPLKRLLKKIYKYLS
jgi:hypothetical protein